MEWCEHSANLNPIAYVWDALGRRLGSLINLALFNSFKIVIIVNALCYRRNPGQSNIQPGKIAVKIAFRSGVTVHLTTLFYVSVKVLKILHDQLFLTLLYITFRMLFFFSHIKYSGFWMYVKKDQIKILKIVQVLSYLLYSHSLHKILHLFF